MAFQSFELEPVGQALVAALLSPNRGCEGFIFTVTQVSTAWSVLCARLQNKVIVFSCTGISFAYDSWPGMCSISIYTRHIHMHMHVCICVFSYICTLCMYVYGYVYIYVLYTYICSYAFAHLWQFLMHSRMQTCMMLASMCQSPFLVPCALLLPGAQTAPAGMLSG